MTAYDAIVIGTGQAGPYVTSRLAGAGMKVAVIERNAFGGTCVNTGCIPTKTLVASARAAHIARRASDYGVMIDSSITIDMKKVKARKDAVVRGSNEGLEKWLKSTEKLTVSPVDTSSVVGTSAPPSPRTSVTVRSSLGWPAVSCRRNLIGTRSS